VQTHPRLALEGPEENVPIEQLTHLEVLLLTHPRLARKSTRRDPAKPAHPESLVLTHPRLALEGPEGNVPIEQLTHLESLVQTHPRESNAEIALRRGSREPERECDSRKVDAP
jgi:hypothetical protein